MKKVGIVIMIIGLVMALYTGFNYVTRKRIIDIGDLKVSANKNHRVDWSPILGAVIIVVGGGIYLFGANRSTAS